MSLLLAGEYLDKSIFGLIHYGELYVFITFSLSLTKNSLLYADAVGDIPHIAS